MRCRVYTLISIFLLVLFHMTAAEMIHFNKGWYFHLGDIDIKEQPISIDSEWKEIILPHDWSIEGEYKQYENSTDWQSGFLPAGIGWYYKEFVCQDDWNDKSIRIQFDGIYMNSEVWINGHNLGKHINGYIGFVYDIKPFIEKGKNVILVRVDHSRALSARWYTGSGIYRNVYLLISGNTYIPYSGVWFRSKNVKSSGADYTVDIEILSKEKGDLLVCTELRDRKGQIIDQKEKEILLSDSSSCHIDGHVNNPSLWSPDAPEVYTLSCRLVKENQIFDEYTQIVGFRSLNFSPDSGFILNGNTLRIKGVCDHHTAGAVGAAVPFDVLYYRLCLLKDMGCNAIRTAHNPFSPEFYTLCDTLGFLVLNEGLDGWERTKAEHDYGLYFNDCWQDDMTAFIKRDRNHPSIFMWSIGNEVLKSTSGTQKKLVDLFHLLDPDRPVTQGGTDPTRGMDVDYDKNFKYLDVVGFNGNGEDVGEFERFRQQFPDRCVIATEVPHSYQTRGVYRSKTQWRIRDFPAPWEKNNKVTWEVYQKRIFPISDLSEVECFPEEDMYPYYQSSYDNASVRISARFSWQRTCSFPWLMGEFRWGSFDYLGEAEWPQRCGNFGVIDIAGIPKDAYYLYKSMWSSSPMVHILPHWTHRDKNGKTIPIVIYTNCDSVKLFLNNKDLGTKKYDGEQLVWNIPYQSGKLKAIGYKEGEEKVYDVQRTADKPYKISCSFDKQKLRVCSNDVIRVEVDVVDRYDVLCPYASNLISFDLKGPIRILGVDNGDPIDHVCYKKASCKAFRGKCVLLIQATDKEGVGSVTFKSDDLVEKKLSFNVY